MHLNERIRLAVDTHNWNFSQPNKNCEIDIIGKPVVNICAFSATCEHVYVYVYVYVCMCMCVCECVYVNVCMYVYV